MNTLTSLFFPLHRLLGLCLCLLVLPAYADSSKLLAVTDLRVESELLSKDNRVLMIEISSDSCGFCRKLEKEFLKPMLKNDDYRKKVLIRTVSIDEGYDLIDLQGERIATSEFASRYQVSLTPTLLFLDSHGREVSERLTGLWSPDYFGVYIDERIDTALEQM